MWLPDPMWVPLRSGAHPATVGVWRVDASPQPLVVKRLASPLVTDDPALSQPAHVGYWRREVLVALHSDEIAHPRLSPPPVHRIDEDTSGATIWFSWCGNEHPDPLQVAQILGSFARGSPGAAPDTPGWFAHQLLEDRWQWAQDRGGWPSLQAQPHTLIGHQALLLWRRFPALLEKYRALPKGFCHGDAVISNFLVGEEGRVIGLDWQGCGTGPLGLDVGVLALSSLQPLTQLAAAFVDGYQRAGSTAECRRPQILLERVTFAARLLAIFGLFSRAEYAHTRPDLWEWVEPRLTHYQSDVEALLAL